MPKIKRKISKISDHDNKNNKKVKRARNVKININKSNNNDDDDDVVVDAIDESTKTDEITEVLDSESADAMKAKSIPNEKQINLKKINYLTQTGKKKLIIILEKANLETISLNKRFDLLSSDEHMGLIKKYKKSPSDCRPDIVHQCLLMLFDSPLNRAGLLQVYIHTKNNVLIKIDPQTRFPRTYKRFAALMVQLIHKLSIRADQGPVKLLQVIKNPITDHLPAGCTRIGTTFQSKDLVKPHELVPKQDEPIAFVIGAMAHGQVDVDYVERNVAISQYPLSAALTCTKIVSAFEDAWGIH